MPRMQGLLMKVTAQDRAWAKDLVDALDHGTEETVAAIIAAIHERAVSCAVVRLEREYILKSRNIEHYGPCGKPKKRNPLGMVNCRVLPPAPPDEDETAPLAGTDRKVEE